jgi:Xaa-Pro aminopeptidase
VRIEDMVRVTSDGAEVLTYLSTELRACCLIRKCYPRDR